MCFLWTAKLSSQASVEGEHKLIEFITPSYNSQFYLKAGGEFCAGKLRGSYAHGIVLRWALNDLLEEAAGHCSVLKSMVMQS